MGGGREHVSLVCEFLLPFHAVRSGMIESILTKVMLRDDKPTVLDLNQHVGSFDARKRKSFIRVGLICRSLPIISVHVSKNVRVRRSRALQR